MSELLKNQKITEFIQIDSQGHIQSTSDDRSLYSDLLHEESEKARKRGFEEGEKNGYNKAKEEEGAYLKLLQTIAEKFLEQKSGLLEQLKPEIIEMAIACAERIIRVELSQREKLVKLIDSFLQVHISSFQGEVVKICLHPDDFVLIEASLSNLKYDKKEIKGVRFGSDKDLIRGDFRIETKTALLNFNISRELDDLRSKILRY